VYLFAAPDWCSRFAVASTLDLTLEIGFVLEGMHATAATITRRPAAAGHAGPSALKRRRPRRAAER
jgi:hypothetical protein